MALEVSVINGIIYAFSRVGTITRRFSNQTEWRIKCKQSSDLNWNQYARNFTFPRNALIISAN